MILFLDTSNLVKLYDRASGYAMTDTAIRLAPATSRGTESEPDSSTLDGLQLASFLSLRTHSQAP